MALVGLLVSWITGSWLAAALWPGMPGNATLWKLCLATGLGTIVGSCSMLVALVLAGGKAWVLVTVDLAVALASWRLMRILHPGGPQPTERRRGQPTKRGILISRHVMVGLALGATIASACVAARVWSVAPHGWWDAWYIWNMRARFLFRGGVNWGDAFADTEALIHRDYPLLLPLTIARLWRYMGEDSTIVPRAVAVLFTGMTIGLLFSSLSVLRSHSQGCLAVVTLLSAGFFVYSGTNQTADVPLAFYMLGTFATLVMGCSVKQSPGSHFTLAGLMAGGAAWTKNEGILFSGLIVAATVLICAVQRGWGSAIRAVGRLALGLTPVLVVVFGFKALAPPNYLFAAPNRSVMLQKVFDPSRHLEILQSAVGVLAGVFDPLLIALLAAYGLVAGFSGRGAHRPGAAVMLLVLVGQLGGYYLAYLTSPFEVWQQASTSMDRLMMQVWPSVVFLFFLQTRTLDETG